MLFYINSANLPFNKCLLSTQCNGVQNRGALKIGASSPQTWIGGGREKWTIRQLRYFAESWQVNSCAVALDEGVRDFERFQ